MKNNINDNNWDILGDKVVNYIPDEYANEDWAAMEKMLYPPTPSIFQIAKQYSLIGASIITVVTAVVLYNNGLFSDSPGNQVESISTQVGQKIDVDKDVLVIAGTSTTHNQINTLPITEKYTIDNNVNNNSNHQQNTAPILASKTKNIDSRQRGNTEVVTQNTGIEKFESNVLRAQITASNTPADNDSFISNVIPGTANTAKVLKALPNTSSTAMNNAKSAANEILTYSTSSEIEDLNQIPYLDLNPLEAKNRELPTSDMIDTKVLDKSLRFGLQVGLNNTIVDYETLVINNTPFFGIFAKKRLSEKWEIELGAQIKYVTEYALTQRYSVTLFDNFGFPSVEEFSVNFWKYTSLDIPLVLKYDAFDKLSLIGGLRYSNLFTQKRALALTTIGSDPNLNIRELAPIQGFWRHDFGVVLGGEYHLANHWDIGLRLNLGTRDITPDNLYSDDNRNHFNSDLQLSLNYTF